MKQPYDIIRRPLITEKGSVLQDASNVYCFEVGPDANKIEIKRTIEDLFNVSVVAVRTLNIRGKNKRFGRFHGKRSNWKKAYVRLAEGHKINLYQTAT
ncbi:50S ribosomal protein L23 [Myxococcota bacterium]|nr:50S ribosomal protein L23 [Myxococcota bacterium]